ncbi:MAG: sigma-70 family RNA polymerase sigma factor [Almyronema sp.]
MDLDSLSSGSVTADSSDLELFQAMRAAQVEALQLLYDRYADLVYSLALKMLGDREEAEDLTQEIFLAIWHRDLYQPSRGSLGHFLVMLTRSRSLDRLRSRHSRAGFVQRWQHSLSRETVEPHPLEQLSQQERAQHIRSALQHLSAAERQVLEIAYYEGLSQSEIAKRLQMPLGTVKTRSRQGLRKLRQLLQAGIEQFDL